MMTSTKNVPGMVQSAALALILYAGAALAADGEIDTANSSITATFRQEGVPVVAAFAEFSGRILYDNDNIDASSATIEVVTGSLDLGDETYNEEVRRLEWFDSANHPKATFQSTAVEAAGEGVFTATGVLTIKGVKQTITVPISVSQTADTQAFDGRFEVSRKAFGIGEPMWDEVLEDTVSIHFHLVSSGPE